MKPPVWLFDLDNTLHDASALIFPRINLAMTEYLARTLNLGVTDADALRQQYWERYGATLKGMQLHHGTNPRHFLQATHQFEDLPRLVVYDRALPLFLSRLPGRKFVFSNAPRNYIRVVLKTTGLHRVVHGVFSVEDVGYHPKPQLRAYRAVLRRLRVNPQQCIMVEDSAQNLQMAKRLGMRTIWLAPAQKCPVWVDLRLNSARQLLSV